MILPHEQTTTTSAIRPLTAGTGGAVADLKMATRSRFRRTEPEAIAEALSAARAGGTGNERDYWQHLIAIAQGATTDTSDLAAIVAVGALSDERVRQDHAAVTAIVRHHRTAAEIDEALAQHRAAGDTYNAAVERAAELRREADALESDARLARSTSGAWVDGCRTAQRQLARLRADTDCPPFWRAFDEATAEKPEVQQ